MTQKIFITGGAGFIGSAVARMAVRAGHDVLVVDNLTYAGNRDNLAEIATSPRFGFLKADIRDGEAMFAAMEEFQPDIVMHLAAESHVDRSIDGPGDFIQTNVVGTYALLQAALGYWRGLSGGAAENFRFHHVSTDEVFGALGETGLFTEDTPYAPRSPYSASKAASDHLACAWGETYGLPVVLSNCSNNYGPYQYPEKLIPLMILNAREGKPLPVYGAGANVRDWLYVDDHAEALLAVAARGAPGESYNVGGDSEKTNLDVVKTLCAVMDEVVEKPAVSDHASLITFVEDRPGHDFRYAIDASKIKRELGWAPRESFESGLRKTVQWYLDNEAWWTAIRNGGYQGQRLGVGRG